MKRWEIMENDKNPKWSLNLINKIIVIVNCVNKIIFVSTYYYVYTIFNVHISFIGKNHSKRIS